MWVCGFLEFLLSTKIAAAVASSYILCLSNKKGDALYHCWLFGLLRIWKIVWCWWAHIFPKAQVTSNKMENNLWHLFLVQFFILFPKVWFALFQPLALEPNFSEVGILQQINHYHFKVSRLQNWPYHDCERVREKMYQKMVSAVVFQLVWGDLRFRKDVMGSI